MLYLDLEFSIHFFTPSNSWNFAWNITFPQMELKWDTEILYLSEEFPQFFRCQLSSLQDKHWIFFFIGKKEIVYIPWHIPYVKKWFVTLLLQMPGEPI